MDAETALISASVGPSECDQRIIAALRKAVDGSTGIEIKGCGINEKISKLLNFNGIAPAGRHLWRHLLALPAEWCSLPVAAKRTKTTLPRNLSCPRFRSPNCRSQTVGFH
jgi:hypothetical protein